MSLKTKGHPLLAGIVGTADARARPALCDTPYNASSSQEIATFALGAAARDDVQTQALFRCAYNSSKLFYDMFCGTQTSCGGGMCGLSIFLLGRMPTP